jgi:hypothetical protein
MRQARRSRPAPRTHRVERPGGAAIADQGFTFDGRRKKHHEIYLGDPRRAASAKLRTILRQPVAES